MDSVVPILLSAAVGVFATDLPFIATRFVYRAKDKDAPVLVQRIHYILAISGAVLLTGAWLCAGAS